MLPARPSLQIARLPLGGTMSCQGDPQALPEGPVKESREWLAGSERRPAAALRMPRSPKAITSPRKFLDGP